jgi:hypothetical protein
MGRTAESDTDPLDELEFHWGSAYHLAVIDGICTARRKDGKGSTLTDPLPEGLRLRILADYHASPVPRDAAAAGPQPDLELPATDSITCPCPTRTAHPPACANTTRRPAPDTGPSQNRTPMPAAAPGPPPRVDPPRHPLHALTTFELRAHRRQLENAIAFFDARHPVPPARDDLQARLDAVLAEQEDRTMLAARA